MPARVRGLSPAEPHNRRADRQVGLPSLHFHDLRHVAATLTAATGAGVKEIMPRLGHSSTQAALRYQHATRAGSRHCRGDVSTHGRGQRQSPVAG